VDAVCLDFSKTFDTVPHSILPEKLAAHGVINVYIENLFSNRLMEKEEKPCDEWVNFVHEITCECWSFFVA